MIPKKIHQFWDGKPMPEPFLGWCKMWRQMHPGWEYKLWNIAAVEAVDPEMGEAMRTTNQHVSVVSDLARASILTLEGGIYLDTDMEPFKALDPIIELGLDAFCVLQGPQNACAVMGTEKGHLWAELMRESAISYAFSAPPWAPTVYCDLAKQCGVTFLPTRWFYPYTYWERDKKDDVFPDAYMAHRHAASWTSPEAKPDIRKEK